MVFANTKTLAVNAISNGTVIDHIQAGQGPKIAALLDLKSHHKQITLGINLPSLTLTRKDLIKIEAWKPTQEEIDCVALLSQNPATFNIIENYEVIQKFKAIIPTTIRSIIICPNPLCITNHEKTERVFRIKNQISTLMLECWYCRKNFKQDEIQTATEEHSWR